MSGFIMPVRLYLFLAILAARGLIPISHEACNRDFLCLALLIPIFARINLKNKWAARLQSFLSIQGLVAVQAVNIMLWAVGLGIRVELDMLVACIVYYLLGRCDEC